MVLRSLTEQCRERKEAVTPSARHRLATMQIESGKADLRGAWLSQCRTIDLLVVPYVQGRIGALTLLADITALIT
jgi:hypothetical protein